MIGKKLGAGLVPWLFLSAAPPALAVPIDLSQLCGATGDCVISSNTTIGSASGPLTVTGNFTVSPGAVLVFQVPIQIRVNGNMVLSGTLGAPGDGGVGGTGGDAGQPGGAGGDAPSVVSGIFDVRGTITVNGNAAAEGGTGGAGGLGDTGQLGGAGGRGGAGGSLTFNACRSFSSTSGAQILVNGGDGGTGQNGALGGAGGAGGSIIINAMQSIVSDAILRAVGGSGGSGGGGAGADGTSGTITLQSGSDITVGANTLNAGTNTASLNQNQSSIDALSFCTESWADGTEGIPTLSEWALLLLSALMAAFVVARRRWR